ncbi:MAG: dihydroorotate dehydrogenase electron transfer subunit [Nitriliruptorales bacterium]|nr:dihydroorotate dehydrogenase electron transfer subunit [Nitriliruptorales bacterium]
MTGIVNRGAAAALRGRPEGPLRAQCEVLASDRIGAYHSLTFVAPEIAERARPGQFVSIGVDGSGTVLRRPFSIYQVGEHGPSVGTVDVVFDVLGPGTAWLAGRGMHDLVDLVGPLGRPFVLPVQPVSCLLVGGGYGAAPLLFLAQALQREGLRVDMILGAASEERVFNAMRAKRLSASAVFTTDDGSLGEQGVVTDVFERVVDGAGTGVVYACGPMAMLAATAAKSKARDLPCQVAVEEQMACGTGVCWTCVIPVQREHGLSNVRACTDGPVFDAARVAWRAIGTTAMSDLGACGRQERT